MKNIAHSIAQRLLNFSKSSGEEHTLVLSRYGVERMLYRLSQSPEGQRFILKGASLFLVWFGHFFRTTRDVDLLGQGPSEPEMLAGIFRGLCVPDHSGIDGLVFNPDSIRVSRIQEGQDYPGLRVQLQALLTRTRIDLQVDVGYGDAITPAPEPIIFPTLLDGPAPKLLAYPAYTAVAEKFLAMVTLDLANSRMKDFYDLCVIFRNIPLDCEILAEAMERTFTRRGVTIPRQKPTALTEAFFEDLQKNRQWNAFVKNNRISVPMGNLREVVLELQNHLGCALERIGIPMHP